MNPFKFGSIVDEAHFTDRTMEIKKVLGILKSENHLILMGPRRYGKSSLIFKAVSQLDRPHIALDLQLVTSTHDLAAQLLKRIYRIYPFEKVRQYVKRFRIIPSISINPVSNAVDVSFTPEKDQAILFEDVLGLFEKLSKRRQKLIVIFDEFQELKKIDPALLKQFRSIMQHHKKVNYVFLGSQESLIEDIFEDKKSPFYHFGMVMPLKKIPEDDFKLYLKERFTGKKKEVKSICDRILSITQCHPYYTQQLAYLVWEMLNNRASAKDPVKEAISELIQIHDMDYERQWLGFNKTDKKLLIGLSHAPAEALSEKFLTAYDLGASSTAYSSIKRLIVSGYVIRSSSKYELDDPFFGLWLKKRRDA